MFDASGMLKLANAAWRSTWGSVIGTGSRNFNILQDSFIADPAVEQAVRLSFNQKETGVESYEYHSSWGETRWLDLRFYPLLTPLGQLLGMTMIQRDVTEAIRSVRRESDLNDQLTALRRDMEMHDVQTGIHRK
jgi:PAS domain-containing protein